MSFTKLKTGAVIGRHITAKATCWGELEIFESRHYICSVMAVGSVQLLSLPQADFHRWLALDNHFNQRMLRFFSQQYYQLSKKASSDNLYSLYQRVCQALWQRYQHDESTTILLDKQNLSQEFAATTRSINRILHDLKSLKIIDTDGERIVLLAPEKLKQEAEISVPQHSKETEDATPYSIKQ